ncbi:MAG: hypothetical protein ABMB14_29215, partial [Myxococcota bacterium]
MLERLPRDLEQQALRRIELDRLSRADPEERRVERRHVVEEPALAHVGLAGGVRIGVVPRVHVPPLAGDDRHRVAPVAEEVPVPGEVADAAGEPDTRADDGDRSALERRHPGLEALNRLECLLQRRQVVAVRRAHGVGPLGTHWSSR